MIDISGYNITQLLSDGNKTNVYRAISESDKKSVIIKVLNKDFHEDYDGIRFRHEMEITNSVINILEVESVDRKLGMVMHDIEGESLSHIINKGKLSLVESIRLSIEIAKSLGQIHKKYIIHKDINPSNIIWNDVTNEVNIIDFGIATKLSHESPVASDVNVLEGTLAYISPEQTGRMNRLLDYRTDFYSLGATLYELLTGQRAFQLDDLIAIVHSHIAVEPISPIDLNCIILNSDKEKFVLQIFSDIIMKLMSKSADERYQSVYGLIYDFEFCLKILLNDINEYKTFELGKHDVSTIFKVPQKLYGREEELKSLETSFSRVTQGKKELFLVTGYSGVGKSSLIHELQKSIAGSQGYFIKGKFDQYMRDIPYSAFSKAISGLIKTILTESENSIADWRDNIQKSVGANGQIIVDLVPELEYLIGVQPKCEKIGLDEAKNRFNTTMQNFIHSLGEKNKPMVIFLDDLQWVDAASLNLIELTMNDISVKNILFIGAYRDNEVGANHVLKDALFTINREIERYRKAGFSDNIGTVKSVNLKPLERRYVYELLCETMHRDDDELNQFTNLCYKKTGGNPFFLNQLLQSLYKESIIYLDRENGIWEYDYERLKTYSISDNVISLMLKKIKELPQTSQVVLKMAACLGNTFDLTTLSTICKLSADNTAKALWEPMIKGFILPKDEFYKSYSINAELNFKTNPLYSFVHDRVQQASYMLLDNENKEKVHLIIGRLLLEKKEKLNVNENTSKSDENINFDIVNHFNLGVSFIENKYELESVIAMNCQAGERALNTNAYRPALKYLENGIVLLEADSFKTSYELSMKLYDHAIEANYYVQNYKRIEELVDTAKKYAKTNLELVKFYEVKMKSLTAQRRLNESISEGLEILEKFDVVFPKKPNKLHTLLSFIKTKKMFKSKSIDDLYNMNTMENPLYIAISRLLSAMATSSYIVRPDLMPLLSLKLVRLYIKHGNYRGSQIYPLYGLMNFIITKDIDASFKYGELGYMLSQKDEFKQSRAQNIMMFYTLNHHWKEHINTSIDNLYKGYREGLESGDIEYASWCLHVTAVNRIFASHELTNLSSDMNTYRKQLTQHQNHTIINIFGLIRQAVANLTGESETTIYMTGEYFNEEENIISFENNEDSTTAGSFYIWKVILSYLYGDYFGAISNDVLTKKYLPALEGLATVPIYYYYASLSYLATYNEVSATEKKKYLKIVNKYQKKMKKWADHAPMNHLHKWHLVEAEIARVNGKHAIACNHFSEAIKGAKTNKYLWEEAQAYELYAKYWLGLNSPELGGPLIVKSWEIYSKWGAFGKVSQLEKQYPDIIKEDSNYTNKLNSFGLDITETSTATGRVSASIIDLSSSIKVFQTISGEVKLDQLLIKIMDLVIENAGAESGYLMQLKSDLWSIEVEGNIANDKRLLSIGMPILHVDNGELVNVDDSNILPLSIIKYVIRTKEAVVLNDATTEGGFINDDYILNNSPKSLICMPLINQGRINGILYLENKLISGAFAPKQVEILNMLTSQAAISLENAMLYHSLEFKVEERTKELQDLSNRYHELSITDQLTKVFNRRKIDELIKSEFEKLKDFNKTLSVILLDIDKFKLINDTYGHLKGDEVLVTLSNNIGINIKETDYFGRWGGEEFILICPDTSLEEAFSLADRLRVIISMTEFIGVNQVTCSFGVAYTHGNKTIDELLNEVDTALYRAKNGGRNRVEVY